MEARGKDERGVALLPVPSQRFFYEPNSTRLTVAYGTKDDLECAKTCAASGVKAALAVGEKGRVELYILEDGTFPRKGTWWLSNIAKTVEITGRVTGAAGSRHIKVDSLRSLPEGAR